MKPKKNQIATLALALMMITSCGGSDANYVPEPGIGHELLNNIEFDYDNAFFDDFSNGVSYDDWYIGKQAWGGNNGGVVPQNVHYTDDGVLVLTGNGAYYNDNDIKGVGDIKDGRYTGGALISKFLVTPGRYEIKMKVLPRQGACTAFWTFAYDINGGLNHEIDIELPGGNRSGVISFSNLLNTNYITEQRNDSQDVNAQSVLGEETYFNDGEWHTFGFDWYTDPELLVYYVDGKITAVSDVFIPTLQSRLWVGCWFPVTSSFVGSANFETDNMYVDYVKYIPFKGQQYDLFAPQVLGTALENEYPSAPISIATQNKVANGGFERLTFDRPGGWTLSKFLNEDQETKDIVFIDETSGYDSSQALRVKDGGLVYQTIDSVYNNFKYDFSFIASGKGRVTIRYYGSLLTDVLGSQVVNIDDATLTEHSLDLTAPQGTQSMRVIVDTSTGNEIIVDNVTLYQK